MNSRITIAAIARAADVSVPTVSKVLNGRPEVAPETRTRVQAVLREVGYQRRPARRQPRAGLIDVVIKELSTPWAVQVVGGAETACHDAGIGLVVSAVRSGRADTRRWLDNLARRRSDGVLLVVSELDAADRARLATLGVPLVLVDPIGDPDPGIASVGATNWAGGLAATEHLVRLGHRRIAMIAGLPGLLCTEARVSGYRTALQRGGLTIDPALIRHGDHFEQSGRIAAEHLLSLPDPPTAVFAGTDLQAFGAYQAIAARGLRIPSDVSVVGFDDLAACDWVTPGLTTVRQPLSEMGRAAIQLIRDGVAAGGAAAHRIELATTLVRRASTAPPPAV